MKVGKRVVFEGVFLILISNMNMLVLVDLGGEYFDGVVFFSVLGDGYFGWI